MGGLQNEKSLPFQAFEASEGPTFVFSSFLPHSFKRFSTLEENFGADINNRTFKCKLFVTNAAKKWSLRGLYFPTKATFF